MPELPEVETMRRGAAAAAGRRIVEVTRPRSTVRPMPITPAVPALRRRLVGRTIAAVERVAKRVVLVLDTGDRLVVEPRMTGLVLLGAAPPTEKHVRLVLSLDDGRDLVLWDQRGLGTIRLLDPAAFEAALGPAEIGPDALLATGPLLRERLGRTRRPVKVALLDQKALAGVGNIYAAEALFRAKVDPRRPGTELDPKAWGRLAKHLVEILEASIVAKGSSLSDNTYRSTDGELGGFAAAHRVYDREGQPCRSCATAIARIVQAQRSTFYCPTCQR